MIPLWTWGGRFFGHREDDSLWTQDGRHVGRFHDSEVYGTDGRYLGEIKNGNRPITCCGKKSWNQSRFMLHAKRAAIVPSVDYVGHIMHSGFEDFP